MLQVQGLKVSIAEKEILKGVDMTVKPGEIHAVMGPNGSGKTTLAMALMGHPNYKIKNSREARSGFARQEPGSKNHRPLDEKIKYQIHGKDMINLLPEERAKAGLFVSFQSPVEVTGVSLLAFLRTAAKVLRPGEKIPLSAFKVTVQNALKQVDLDADFMQRSVNEGFSGGERKRAEIVQLLVLRPKFAILDEIDSGLDVDSLRVVAKAIKKTAEENNMGIIVITHYQRILHHLKPDVVHVMIDGRIQKSGKIGLVRKIEKEGYAAI